MGFAEDIEEHRCPNCGSFDIEVDLEKGTFCRDCGEKITEKDVVEDYYIDGELTRHLVSRYHCPPAPVDNRPFDPYTPEARAAFQKHRKKFKNRRRYQKDRERRYS